MRRISITRQAKEPMDTTSCTAWPGTNLIIIHNNPTLIIIVSLDRIASVDPTTRAAQ